MQGHEGHDHDTDADVLPTAFLHEDSGMHGTDVSRSYTIGRPRQEVYQAFRDFGRWPEFMENLKSVEVRDERTSHWVVAGPMGKTYEWDSVVTEDRPGERIEWRSAEDADVEHSGWIEFSDAPADRGTVVRALISYDPPGGVVGKVVAKIFQREPNIQLRRDLRRFKQLLETGEITTSRAPEAAPRGSFS